MASLDDLAAVLKRQDVADAIAARVPFAWFKNKYGNPVQFESLLGQLDLNINNNHAALISKIAGVPPAVLNQPFTTPTGTATNLAGILAQIDGKPAGTAAVAAVDVDALATKLAAVLPPAVVAQLATQLAKL
jgi:hypothetical protein